ncbi:MAG: tetratricopeptide repeat protein, partial [Planctomycetes bacterium]|nr:tetratricopeptide repeat protein [Planctomycetota bacterium]
PQAILADEPPDLRRHGTGADLAAIVQKALQKAPERRYGSAASFLADLRAWQSGGEVGARAPGLGERLVRWIRREPWRATAAVLLGVLVPVAAGSLGYVWANAGRIAAATAAERAAVRERALTAAWLALAEEEPGAGIVALGSLTAPAGDVEVAIARAALLLRAGRRDEARAALLPVVAEPAVRLVQMQMDDRDAADFDFARATPGTAIECFVLGLLAYDQVHLHKKDRALLGVASRWLGTAVAMAQEPRASFLFWWMVTAARAGDAAAFAAALAAYERHFPGSRGLQLAHVLCASSVPVERGLAVLGTVDLAAFPRAHLALALLYERAGRLPESERAYRAGLAAEPRNLQAWLQLVGVLDQQKKFAEAAEAAREATVVDPRSADAWSRLGTSLVQADRPAEGRAALERAIAEGPAGWRPHFNLGLLLRDAGEHEAALAAFLRAAELAPPQPEPRAFAARVLRQLGRPQEALVEDVRALQCRPSDWRQWSVVAGNLAATGLHG